MDTNPFKGIKRLNALSRLGPGGSQQTITSHEITQTWDTDDAQTAGFYLTAPCPYGSQWYGAIRIQGETHKTPNTEIFIMLKD